MAQKRIPVQNVITFRNSQGEKARGTLMKLTRSTVVLEVYNPYSIVQLSEVLDDLTIYRGDRSIYKGRATVSNLVNTGLMLIVSATLVDAWKDLTHVLYDPKKLQEEVRGFLHDYETTRQLRPTYQLAVMEIQSLLYELSRWLGQVDTMMDSDDTAGDDVRQQELIEKLSEPVLPKLLALYQEFEEEASKVGEDEVITHKVFVQQNLHPLLMRSPFVHRMFHKPLGYAGDYEMMNMIQRNYAEGPTTYAKIVNSLFVQMPISRSVANRTKILTEYLTQEASRVSQQGKKLRVLTVACGPAREVRKFIRKEPLSEGCRIRFVDFDQDALNHAEAKIRDAMWESKRAVEVEFIHESVHILLKRAARGQQERVVDEYDLVYCSGLFDYLSDRVCSRLLRLFYRWVIPGGMVFVTNMHPSNPNIQAMEYIMEWHLIYRTEEQVADWVPGLGKQRVFLDSTGVNVGLEIRKPVKEIL